MAQQVTIWFTEFQGTENEEFSALTQIAEQARASNPRFFVAYTIEEVADENTEDEDGHVFTAGERVRIIAGNTFGTVEDGDRTGANVREDDDGSVAWFVSADIQPVDDHTH